MATHGDDALFDWASLWASSPSSPPPPEFVHDGVRVQRVAGRGWGVVATRDLSEGTLVMACPPVAVARPGEPCAAASPHAWARGKPDRVLLLRRIHAAVLADASGRLRAAIRALSGVGDAAGAGASPSQSDDDVAVAACEANAFSITHVGHAYQLGGDARPAHDDGELVGCGLWLAPSRLNHSCAPNCRWSHVGDVMVVRATQRVAAGDELTHSYVGVVGGLADGARRRARLRAGYGFDCRCELCSQERALAAQLGWGAPAAVAVGTALPPTPAPAPPALSASSLHAWRLKDTDDPDGVVSRCVASLPLARPDDSEEARSPHGGDLLGHAMRLAVGACVSVAGAGAGDSVATPTAAVPLLVRVAACAALSGLPTGAALAGRWLATARDCAWCEGVRGTQLDEGVKAALQRVLLMAQHPRAFGGRVGGGGDGGDGGGGRADADATVRRLQGEVDAARRAFALAYPVELFARMPVLRFLVDEANAELRAAAGASWAAVEGGERGPLCM